MIKNICKRKYLVKILTNTNKVLEPFRIIRYNKNILGHVPKNTFYNSRRN